MKYKDIESLFNNKAKKIKIALRIRKCSKPIRKAIDEWVRTGCEPNYQDVLPVKDSKNEEIVLSTKFLINYYGFTPLDSLLFIDMAVRSEKDAYKAMSMLSRKFEEGNKPLTKDEWKQIDPEVMAAYHVIVENKRKQEEQEEQEYQKFEKEEIGND